MSQSSENAAAPTARSDADKTAQNRMRELVERRLAKAPARGEGSLKRPGKADLHYSTIAEFNPVLSAAFDARPEEPQAAVFTISYLQRGEPGIDTAPPRPVCFAFNGGPGSSSVWLHLGALGPKRAQVQPDR